MYLITPLSFLLEIATITYRSGPEWDLRFGRQLRPLSAGETDPQSPRVPALCPDFLIETYLDHQGESFCLKYDANSLLYISRAMDLFDMTLPALDALDLKPRILSGTVSPPSPASRRHAPMHVQPHKTSHSKSHPPPANPPAYLPSLSAGLRPLSRIPTLVLGVQSDILFAVEQQREVADALRMAGNSAVSYYELGGVWGHDTFLIDVLGIGGAVRGFL